MRVQTTTKKIRSKNYINQRLKSGNMDLVKKKETLFRYREILSGYPFARDFFEGRIDEAAFLENLKTFSSQLIRERILSDSDIQALIAALNQVENMIRTGRTDVIGLVNNVDSQISELNELFFFLLPSLPDYEDEEQYNHYKEQVEHIVGAL